MRKYPDNTVTATLQRLENAIDTALLFSEEVEKKLKSVVWARTLPSLHDSSGEENIAVREKNSAGSQEEKCSLTLSLNKQIRRANTIAFNLANLSSRIEL